MLTTEKKRTFKMFVAWLVVLSLMLPATMVPAFATDTDPNVPSENRAKIGMAFLGTGDAPKIPSTLEELGKLEKPDTSTWQPGVTKFWVGIYISNLTNIDRLPVTDLLGPGGEVLKSHIIIKDNDYDSC